MALFDMTFETGTWEFKHRILAPIALSFILPTLMLIYLIVWIVVWTFCFVTGERNIIAGR